MQELGDERLVGGLLLGLVKTDRRGLIVNRGSGFNLDTDGLSDFLFIIFANDVASVIHVSAGLLLLPNTFYILVFFL